MILYASLPADKASGMNKFSNVRAPSFCVSISLSIACDDIYRLPSLTFSLYRAQNYNANFMSRH